ncbi:MAG: LptE family protein [Acidobacteria bacterium]|nr:LptE family protein [Acidobacteriota bacterium]
MRGSRPAVRRGGARRWARLGVLVGAAASLHCGYRLIGHGGALEAAGIGSIGVPVFQNRTHRPEIDQRITEQVIGELINRTKLVVKGSEAGVDALLEGEILAYVTQPVTVNPEGRTTRYEITVRARVALEDLRRGGIVWEDPHFVFQAQYDVDPNVEEFVDEEIVAIDKVARGFAASVVTSLLDGF